MSHLLIATPRLHKHYKINPLQCLTIQTLRLPPVSAPINLVQNILTYPGLPVTFHTPMASSSSIEPRATTYADIIEVLGPDADLLDYLPSADEVHQLFAHYDKTHTIKFPKGHSGTPKLLFGTFQEEDTTMSHVFVYLRSPSFDNKEPSMTFMKFTANLRFVIMGSRAMNKTYESLELNDIWKPLIRKNGKIHLQALRGVLKVFYVRKGIKLSAPIPVRDPDLIQGCQMFKNYAEQSNHEANQSVMNMFGTDTPSSIASRGPSAQHIFQRLRQRKHCTSPPLSPRTRQ